MLCAGGDMTLRRCHITGGLLLLVACSESPSAPKVVSVTVAPAADTLPVGDSVRLVATVRDANGSVLTNRVVTWTSDDPSEASVSSAGVVTGVAAKTVAAKISAASGSIRGSASIAVVPVVTVTAISPDSGPLTGGTVVSIGGDNFVNVSAVSVGGVPLVAVVVVSPTLITGTTRATSSLGASDVLVTSRTNGHSSCSGCFRYLAVSPADTVRFVSVQTGAYRGCGRTSAGVVYCWGSGGFGQLGNGTTAIDIIAPLLVGGGLTYDTIAVGDVHVCGLTAAGAAYCWGADEHGELGAGTPGPTTCSATNAPSFPCSGSPMAVAGGLQFVSLSSGVAIACGLDASGSAYCWGGDEYGELGIGTDTASLAACTFGSCSRTPLAVVGGLLFTTLATGAFHACGLTSDGQACCWGSNALGELGVGVDAAPDQCALGPCSRKPLAVSGGLTFTALRARWSYTCGHATDGDWYCWGLNDHGQLGNGTTGPDLCTVNSQTTRECSGTPTRVSVGNFTSLWTGGPYACGLPTAGAASCWGRTTTVSWAVARR